jgi:hypothetical protein
VLIDARGQRIDQAPGDIVFDPTRSPGTIVAGASCMGCHVGGLLRKDNQVMSSALSQLLPDSVRREVDALYASQGSLDAAIAADTTRVTRALGSIDTAWHAPTDRTKNPFLVSADRYAQALDGRRLAAEFGLTPPAWATFVRTLTDAELRAAFLPTVVAGGSVKRETVEQLYSPLLRYLDSR